MSETPPNDKPAKDFNKIDLAQLQSFSFGTQWSQDKTDAASGSAGAPRESRRDDRPRRDGPGAGAPRDRRGFRKPAGPAEGDSAPASAGEAPASAAPRERREGGFESRGPRREGPGAGAPRGDFRGGQGGPRREGGPRFGGPREGGGFPPREQGPYVSPFFNVTFYPDDTGFSALSKAIRSSCRTYELFEIARVIIGKNDRFIAVVQHKPAEQGAAPAKAVPFAISIPDGLPFENEEAAINHVIEKHLGQFFETAEVEIDAPKGNFQVVNKCTVTGELLGPPNYHRYNQIVQQHHAANIKLPFEVYRNKIESVREPEAIAQWLEKMKKTTRYTWKVATPAAASSAPAVETAEAAAPAEGETPSPETAPATEPAAAPAGVSFDSFEEARQYLLSTAKDKVVRTVESVRFAGKNLESLPQGELRRTIEGALERQRRFPLDTANALRGRLRREGFTIFKKGSKGISYVCAVKRKFRVPGQTFSESIGALISFIESHPMIKASELPEKFLGFSAPAAPAKQPAAPAEGAESAAVEAPAAPAALTPEQNAKLNRLNGDLRWLVSEGYVTEFIDGRLFAPAPVVESRKKEIEGAEHDPENFPEVPVAATESPKVEGGDPAS